MITLDVKITPSLLVALGRITDLVNSDIVNTAVAGIG